MSSLSGEHRPSTFDPRALAAEHGPSFYVLDLGRFAGNLERFRHAFATRWAAVEVGWSYKTQWTPALCAAAHRAGALAEVVSRMEYDLARRLGVPGDRVLFNGPVKSDADLALAASEGARIHFDGLDEVERFTRLGHRVAVGLRLNLEPEPDQEVSRFGLDPDEAREAVRRLADAGIPVRGLHAHRSAPRTPAAYRRRAEGLVAAADALLQEPPAWLDVGGGYMGPLPPALAAQLGAGPSYDDYAEAIVAALRARWPRGGPTLVLEPGVGVVADAMYFVSTVVACKRARGRAVAVLTGGRQNIKPTDNPIRLPVTVWGPTGPRPGEGGPPVDLTGYTCMEADTLAHGHQGPVEVGDLVVIGNVGAYSVVFKPPFIRPAPPIVAVDGDRRFVARRAETLDDLLACYPEEAP